jgi:hypothetical protein
MSIFAAIKMKEGGRVIAQAVNRWPLDAETRDHAHGISLESVVDEVALGMCSSACFSFLLCILLHRCSRFIYLYLEAGSSPSSTDM